MNIYPILVGAGLGFDSVGCSPDRDDDALVEVVSFSDYNYN